MTPKEKAVELSNKFYQDVMLTQSEAKQCALIAVDEILTYNTFWDKKIANRPEDTEEFWTEVKQEIEKL